MKITKSGHKKVKLLNEKMKKKTKIDEENLQLHCLVKKAADKLMNQITNFEELKCQKYLNINQ